MSLRLILRPRSSCSLAGAARPSSVYTRSATPTWQRGSSKAPSLLRPPRSGRRRRRCVWPRRLCHFTGICERLRDRKLSEGVPKNVRLGMLPFSSRILKHELGAPHPRRHCCPLPRGSRAALPRPRHRRARRRPFQTLRVRRGRCARRRAGSASLPPSTHQPPA